MEKLPDLMTSLSSSSEDSRRRRPAFKRRHRISSSSNDADVSNIDTDRDLTPGSLEVWLDLPDEIKYDPFLAPFQRLYEQQNGKLDASEGDHTIFKKELNTIGENKEEEVETINGGHRLLQPLHTEELESAKRKHKKNKRLDRALRVIKLSALVACWLLLTISLILNREETNIMLHTAVKGGEIKVYDLQPMGNNVRVLVTLTGPFVDTSANGTDNILFVWIHKEFNMNNRTYEQNSTRWAVRLQPDEILDFSPSDTESKTLYLDCENPILNTSSDIESLWTTDKDERISLCMSTTGQTTVPLTVSYQLNPLEEFSGIIYATILLCSLYILIIFEIINRTIAALLSSSLSIAVLSLCGMRPSLSEIVSWLDSETLLLLLSMMLLVAIIADTGLFDTLAVLAFQVTNGKTWPLITCLCFFTAFFSTFLDNVTTVLLMTPVTIRLCEVMELNPVPVLMSMVIFSNVGGAATPVGDPPNVIIASHPAALAANLNFTTFTLHMGLGILLVSVQTYLQLRYMFRNINTLQHSEPRDLIEMRQEVAVWKRAAASLTTFSKDEELVKRALEKKVEKLNTALLVKETGGSTKSRTKFRSTLAEMKDKYHIRDKPLLIKSSICMSFVIAVFFLHAIPELQRLSLGWTALLGALLLLLLSETQDLEPILARVEWSTLLFFAALFVLMEALSKLGLIAWIGKMTEVIILKVGEESRLAVAVMLILWVSGLASAFVDNIPLTTMMVRVIAALADPNGLALPLAPLAWALSFGACLGGNGTLIGASANVVCAGVAEQHGYRFSFVQFFKIGFPIMLGNLVVASIYLLFCHCVFQWH